MVNVEVLIDNEVPDEIDVPRLFKVVLIDEVLRCVDNSPVAVGPLEEVVFGSGYGTVDTDVDGKIVEEMVPNGVIDNIATVLGLLAEAIVEELIVPLTGPMVIDVNETALPVGPVDEVELETGYGTEVLEAECRLLDESVPSETEIVEECVVGKASVTGTVVVEWVSAAVIMQEQADDTREGFD